MKKACLSVIIVLLSLLALTPALYALEPPAEPILKVDSGMHTAMITRIGIDDKNRWLVTGSFGKTVRVWELSTGNLVKTLRIPIGDGNEGKIFAAAISPDGSTIACGGWTGYEWDLNCYIYLFDRQSGRLTKRITGLPNVITHLAFSKGGRYLAATLHEGGIRIYRTKDYKLIGKDTAYDSQSNWADFSSNNRLVTSCLDGYIRLYDPIGSGSLQLKPKVKKRAPGGKHPFSVAFSPDGTRIAVGLEGTPRVNVFSGKDLSHLYSPDTTGVTNGDLSKVAWSQDGSRLYAGGGYYKGGCPILMWPEAGRGKYRELKAADNTVMHITALNNGGIAFGAGDPAFGVIDAAGTPQYLRSPNIADYRDNLKGFLISRDGDRVRFGYKTWGKSPAVFSVQSRRLNTDNIGLKDSSLTPPIIEASGLNVTGWEDTKTPKLNGKALKLDQYEFSRSLAISPDIDSFLLGADWYLRLFDRNGREKWNVPVPGTAWSVNISGNGKTAAAAFGDGTIRWYRITDGKELLAFFPHNDQKRWVLWTPSGYYDASPGADTLIGWHLNNGKDNAADFFSVSKFKARFYRPDVTARVLDTLDEKEAVRLADAEAGRKKQEIELKKMLPPVVTIVSPSDGVAVSTTELTVRYSVRSPSGEPVSKVKALVNGRPVEWKRGMKIKNKKGLGEIKVTIPKADAEIAIIAENRYAASEPARVKVKWQGTEEYVIKPKLYVLAIGVSKYQDKALTLLYAAKDARDFAEAFKNQKGALYRDVEVKLITDENAIKGEILDGLDWIVKETTSKDVAVIFIAGHGVNGPSGDYFFFPSDTDKNRLRRTGLAFYDIKSAVASLAGKTVLFADTCHSGNIMGARRGVADINAFVNELSSAENGAIVFTSSTGRQYSIEDEKWGNGAFTEALVEGINGKADYSGKGRITINMLDLYVSERVKELTGGNQTPTSAKPQTVPDFPIAIRR